MQLDATIPPYCENCGAWIHRHNGTDWNGVAGQCVTGLGQIIRCGIHRCPPNLTGYPTT